MSLALDVVGKRVENRYLVREQDRRRARDLGAVALVLAPLAVVLLIFAWENVESIRRGYEVRQLSAERDRLLEENRRLRSEAGSRARLAEVDRKARAAGFREAEPDQVIHLVDSSAGGGSR